MVHLCKIAYRCLLALMLMLAPSWALANTKYKGPQVTHAEVVAALQKSPNANTWIKQNAHAIASLALNVESSGYLGIYNGSCCYGILQMNRTNIRAYAKTDPETFRRSSLQFQVDAWSKLTSEAMRNNAPHRLSQMSTFDGRPVTPQLVLACIQLGIGNCQKMLNSGKCSGFMDRNKTTICAMADKTARGMGQAPATPVSSGDSGCPAADPSEFLSDADGYGSLDETDIGEYASMSPLEMIMTEAERRLGSDSWQKKLTTVSSRALWVDYTKAIAVENYLRRLNYEKRERIEAQMTNLVAILVENQRLISSGAAGRAKADQINSSVR